MLQSFDRFDDKVLASLGQQVLKKGGHFTMLTGESIPRQVRVKNVWFYFGFNNNAAASQGNEIGLRKIITDLIF